MLFDIVDCFEDWLEDVHGRGHGHVVLSEFGWMDGCILMNEESLQ